MPTTMASDLRSEAKSYQRDKNHNSKWSRGFTPRPDVKCPHRTSIEVYIDGCGECPARPIHQADHNHGAIQRKHLARKKNSAHASTLARKALRNEVDGVFDGPLALVTDTSSDDEVHDASAAPLPTEADFMYSYDSNSGPTSGRDILSAALNKAVQRFENTETEKLVTREYDVVDQLYAADEDEDDYEMVEHAHIN